MDSAILEKEEKIMINKEQFMCFVKRVERTEKGIIKLEEAFGSLCFREQDFCHLQNYADKIAFMLLGFEESDCRELFDAFSSDFWNMLDKGEVRFSYIDNMSNNIEVVINTWEDFYKYWVSEEWRLNENDAWDATK